MRSLTRFLKIISAKEILSNKTLTFSLPRWADHIFGIIGINSFFISGFQYFLHQFMEKYAVWIEEREGEENMKYTIDENLLYS